MKSTKGPQARRALAALLLAASAPGQPLEGWQVEFSFPQTRETKCIYMGGFRLRHESLSEEQEVVGAEVVTIGVYFRCLIKGGTVELAEQQCEAAADAMCNLFAADPDLGGAMTWMGVDTGQGDYSETPDGPEAILSLQINVGAVLI